MIEDKIYEKGSFGWLRKQAKKDGFDNIRNWQNWKNYQRDIDQIQNIDQVKKILEENKINIKDKKMFYKFWSNVDIKSNIDDCWNYVGCVDENGYGVVYYGMRAHRMVYLLMKGKIPDKLQIQHLCNNRSCCNPNHLELGDYHKNNQYTVKCGRWSTQKLTEDQVREIHKLYIEERRQHPNYLKWHIQKRLAKEFGIDGSYLNRIVNGVFRHNIYEEFHGTSSI